MKEQGKGYVLMDDPVKDKESQAMEMELEEELDDMTQKPTGSFLGDMRVKIGKKWGSVKRQLHKRGWRIYFLIFLSIIFTAGFATYLGIFTKNQSDFHLTILEEIQAPPSNTSAPFLILSLVNLDLNAFNIRMGTRARLPTEYSPDGLIIRKKVTLVVNEVSYAYGVGAKNNLLSYVNARIGDGSVYLYPFDVYHTEVEVYLLDENSNPINFTLQLGKRQYGGYAFKVEDFRRHESVFEAFKFMAVATRDPSFVVYPIFQIVAFWFITIWAAGMSMSITMFALKKSEGFLLIVTASLLFALPSFRNTSPQAPPIGCVLDVSSFYWAMFGVLGLFFGVSIRYLQHAPLPPAHVAPAPHKA